MIYNLTNKKGVRLSVTDFGCRIMNLYTPDRNGVLDDIVLGGDTEDYYINYGDGERFLGCVVGRYANRIANGRFTLDGKEYVLPQNNGSNCLHGGLKGFDLVRWDVIEADERHIVLRHLSPDGEEGFPGNVEVTNTYTLTDDNELIIEYSATTDKPTVLNMTNHSFFNLHGEGLGDIKDMYLTVNADTFLPVDANLIPLSEAASVEGTPFDFRTPRLVGERLFDNDPQLLLGNGYDHNWILNKTREGELSKAAEVHDPQTGRVLEVFTTQPGLQIYGGNFFNGKMVGKRGKRYDKFCSLALETQHFPNCPNRPDFPSTVLRPNETYTQKCIYKFSTDRK